MWDAIAADAAAESPVWSGALLSEDQRRPEAVFSPLAPAELALGLETVYEGYLVHYGRSRLFAQDDPDTSLLLGDYLYAHGLVRVGATGNVTAVADLAELISLCAQARAEGRNGDGDGPAWAATAARLGLGGLDGARDSLRLRGDSSSLDATSRSAAGEDAVRAALTAHARHVG